MTTDHEALFVKAFIASEKRARFLQFLKNPKRRPEALGRLNHTLPYLPDRAAPVPSGQDFPEGVAALLRAKGAGPTCHLIVDRSRLDGREMALDAALREVFLHPFGAVVSCIPGVLAYYKPEAPGEGLLLENPRGKRI